MLEVDGFYACSIVPVAGIYSFYLPLYSIFTCNVTHSIVT